MRTLWIILLSLGLSPTVALAKPVKAKEDTKVEPPRAASAAETRTDPASSGPSEKGDLSSDAAPTPAADPAAPPAPDAAADSDAPLPDPGASAIPADAAGSIPADNEKAAGAPSGGGPSLVWIGGGVLLIAGAAGAFWWSTRRASKPASSKRTRSVTRQLAPFRSAPGGSTSDETYSHRSVGGGQPRNSPGMRPVQPTEGAAAAPLDAGPPAEAQPPGDVEVAGGSSHPEETYVETPIEATRAGTGAHAPLIELLDRGLSDLQAVLTQPHVAARHDKGERDLGQLDYFVRLLILVSDHGAATHQSRFSDDRVVSGPDDWLDVFAPSVLDVFSTRATELLLAGLEGDEPAARAGEAYRDFLEYTVPEVLRLMDLTAVPVFPLAGNTPDAPGVKVMGRVRQSGFTGQVVGVNQYGIVRGRVVVREAHVTTGS